MLNLKQSVFSLAIMTIFAISSSSTFAQDDAGQDLQKAIGKIKDGALHLTANIEFEKPKADQGNGAMGIMLGMSIGSGGPDHAEMFTGEMDVYLTADGVLAATSAEGLPEVNFIDGGKQSSYRQYITSRPTDLTKLQSLIRGTLDLEGLQEEVSRAKRVRVTDKDGMKTFRVTLDGQFFDASGDDDTDDPRQKMIKKAMSNMQPKVMESIFTMSINEDGSVAGMKYVLQYNDPMKAIMGQAMAGGRGRIQIGGQGKQPDDVPGKKIVVSYNVLADSSGPAKSYVDRSTEKLKKSAN